MFFLLRVAFWLAVVFWTLPWPDQIRPPARAAIEPKARDLLGKAVAEARAGIEKACLDAPGACLEAASGVGRLGADARRDARPKPAPSGQAR